MASEKVMRIIFVVILGIGYSLAAPCPDSSWVSFNTSCYKFLMDDYRNFYDSEMACRSEGGQLVHVDTKQENDYIKNKLTTLQRNEELRGLTHIEIDGFRDNNKVSEFANMLKTAQEGNFWNGLTDFLEYNKWLFYGDNSTVSFFDWYPGEPNNFMGQEEHCVVFYATLGYKWVDAPCDSYFQPICEISGSADGSGLLG